MSLKTKLILSVSVLVAIGIGIGLELHRLHRRILGRVSRNSASKARDRCSFQSLR